MVLYFFMAQYNIYMKCLQRLNAEVNTEHDYVVNDQQTTVCIIIPSLFLTYCPIKSYIIL